MLIGLALPAVFKGGESITLTPPAFVSLAISGSPSIGSTLSVTYTVAEPERLMAATQQWRRDGVAIAGANALDYTVSASDAGVVLDCVVTLTDMAGLTATQTADPVTVLATPPQAVGMSDQTLDVSALLYALDFSGAFSGAEVDLYESDSPLLTFEGSSSVAEIDVSNLLTATVITVTASNASGSASVSFTLRVVAVPNVSTLFFSDILESTNPLVAPLDTDGVWVTFKFYFDGENAGNAAIAGFRRPDQLERMTARVNFTQYRRNSGTNLVTASRPNLTDPGWYRILSWFQGNASGRMDISHYRSDDPTPVVRTSVGSTSLANDFALFSQWHVGGLLGDSAIKGHVADVAIGTGDPTAFFNWLSGDTQTRDVVEYDFASDPTAVLAEAIPFVDYQAGAPDTVEPYDVTRPALDNYASGTAVERVWTAVQGLPTWGTIAPGFSPFFLDLPIEPSLTEAGGVLTLDRGGPSGNPTPAQNATWYRNGTDVTLEVANDQYTIPPGDAQIVVVLRYTTANSTMSAFIDRVMAYETFAHDETGDDLRKTVMATGWASSPSGGVAEADYTFLQFDQAYPCASFITNGAMTIGSNVRATAKWPESAPTAGCIVNGMEKNPEIRKNFWSGGFDSWHAAQYVPELNVGAALPVDLVAGDVLVGTRCNEQRVSGVKNSLRDFCPFVVLGSTPFHDSFRPAVLETTRALYRESAITRTLPQLSASGLTVPALEEATRKAQTYFHDAHSNWARDWIDASQTTWAIYGRGLIKDYQDIFCWLMSDEATEAEKRAVRNGFIQHGIDQYHSWRDFYDRQGFVPRITDGGHHNGRKLLIVFAGEMLGESAMRDVYAQTDVTEKAQCFHEDRMTAYVTQAIVDITNSGLTTVGGDWSPAYLLSNPHEPYQQGMMAGAYPVPEWHGGNGIDSWDAHWDGHNYRGDQNHGQHDVTVFVLRAMGLVGAWGHPPFFEYHLRHTALDEGRQDPWITQGGASGAPFYNQIAGVPPPNAGRSSTFDYQMLYRHFPEADTYPWA